MEEETEGRGPDRRMRVRGSSRLQGPRLVAISGVEGRKAQGSALAVAAVRLQLQWWIGANPRAASSIRMHPCRTTSPDLQLEKIVNCLGTKAADESG